MYHLQPLLYRAYQRFLLLQEMHSFRQNYICHLYIPTDQMIVDAVPTLCIAAVILLQASLSQRQQSSE